MLTSRLQTGDLLRPGVRPLDDWHPDHHVRADRGRAVFLVLGQGCAATACYLHAEVKGYPPLIGLPLGVSFGFLAVIVLTLLPDESEANTFEFDREMTHEGVERRSATRVTRSGRRLTGSAHRTIEHVTAAAKESPRPPRPRVLCHDSGSARRKTTTKYSRRLA